MNMDKLLHQVVQSPTHFVQKHDPETIASLLSQLDDSYTRGNPRLSDEVYDLLRESFQKRFPSHAYHAKVGHFPADDDNASAITKKQKVTLPFYMGSMNKLVPSKGQIMPFFKNHTKTGRDNFLITDKLDGISALLTYTYQRGKQAPVITLYTRGDGKTGQDISHVLKFIKGVPRFDHGRKDNQNMNIALRGELIIPRQHLSNMRHKGYANLRNLVAGLMNTHNPDTILLRLVHFVAYTVLEPAMLSPSDQMAWFSAHDIPHTVHFESFDTQDIDEKDESQIVQKLSHILTRRKEESLYEIDGLVVSHDAPYPQEEGLNPRHAFAFKSIIFDDQAEVVVKTVHWQMNRNGILKPVVEFDPVCIDQVMVKRATAFHAQYVLQNNIGVGARLLIRRSGQVIPNIIRVTKAAEEASFPTSHPFYWIGVDISVQEKTKTKNETRDTQDNVTAHISPELQTMMEVKRLEHFFHVNKVEHLSGKRIERLFRDGHDNAKKILFHTSRQDLYNLLGLYGYKIHDGLVKKREFIAAPALLHGSGAFSNNDLGEKSFALIVHRFPNVIFDSSYVPDVTELMDIDGISKRKAESFLQGLKVFREMQLHDKIPAFYESPALQQEAQTSSGPLEKEIILFTGFRNKSLEEDLTRLGAQIASSMTNKVTILLVSDKSTMQETTKIKQARTKGVRIMDVTEMFRFVSTK